MSFLNPVNEPVLRFSSTDADAPQINYNARVAGDIKAVLKACLVTGYGAKASAGWTAVNEVSHVIEFVSPSVAMSDYRLGIDDTSAATTIWYSMISDVRTTLDAAGVNKAIGAITPTNSRNGWELIVTARGLLFIETVSMKHAPVMGSSVTYWGQLKADYDSLPNQNISWWSVGYNSPSANQGSPSDFFNTPTGSGRKYIINGYAINNYAHPALPVFVKTIDRLKVSEIQLVSDWFLIASDSVVAQQPGLMLELRRSSADVPVTGVSTQQGRDVFRAWPLRGATSSTPVFIYNYANAIFVIPLDYWEY